LLSSLDVPANSTIYITYVHCVHILHLKRDESYNCISRCFVTFTPFDAVLLLKSAVVILIFL